jgi:hypothetical protein
MAKCTHTLMVNKPGKGAVQYTYAFGQTKNIQLLLSATGFSITAELTRVYSKEEMLSGNSYLFSDAIKKALLLYLLKYNKTPQIKTITVNVDDREETDSFDKTVKPPFYSMISGELQRPLSAAFAGDELFCYLLRTPKTKYDKRIAALFAFLCSKSKAYETERFIYLWTSLNGMYGWISELVVAHKGISKGITEGMQLRAFQQFLDVGSETMAKDDKVPIAQEVIALLKKMDLECASKSAIEGSELAQKIESNLVKSKGGTYDLSAYGYLLTQLSYYFRCKIIHGSKPVYLFSYADDPELHCLKIINKLLEEYIDSALPQWFVEQYINDSILPKILDITIK